MDQSKVRNPLAKVVRRLDPVRPQSQKLTVVHQMFHLNRYTIETHLHGHNQKAFPNHSTYLENHQTCSPQVHQTHDSQARDHPFEIQITFYSSMKLPFFLHPNEKSPTLKEGQRSAQNFHQTDYLVTTLNCMTAMTVLLLLPTSSNSGCRNYHYLQNRVIISHFVFNILTMKFPQKGTKLQYSETCQR